MPFRVIETDDTTTTPTPDEEFVLLFPSPGQAIYAPDRTGLVEALIPGYGDLDANVEGDDEALYLRYNAAKNIAAQVRETIFGSMVSEGKVSYGDYTEDELNTILPHGAFEPGPPFTGEWTDRVPLVLLRTDYAPFSAYEAPSGNVLYIDPYTETTFLDSLDALGLFKVIVREG